MSPSLLRDAFEHHVWATLRLLDSCAALSEEHLAAAVPGTYGSILDTLRHVVGVDSGYLFILTEGRVRRNTEDAQAPAELHATMVRNGEEWASVLNGDLDPDAVLVVGLDDESETRAPASIPLAQALHHGTDHRSQVCTALTTLGVEPPFIDVWAFGTARGRVVDFPRTS